MILTQLGAFQSYKDDSVVEWTGDEGEDSQHSITDIVADISTDGHEATAKKDKNKKEETKTEADKTTDTN